jgi:hypothetical protein
MKRRLQGFAPRLGPYHRSPYSSARWPVLPGLFSPSRPFDRCATEAASRRMSTRSTGGSIRSVDNPCVSLPAPFEEPRSRRGFGEHRSVPYSSLSSRRSSRRGRARRHGPNSRHTRRCSRKQSALSSVLPRPETSARHTVSRAFRVAPGGAHPRGDGPSHRGLGSSAAKEQVFRVAG